MPIVNFSAMPSRGGRGASSLSWANEIVTMSGFASAMSLASDGYILGVEGTSISDYAPFVTSGNGGDVLYGESYGWQGSPGVRIVPPDTILVGSGNAENVKILSQENMNGGKEVNQINIGYMVFFTPGWANANATGGPKWIDLWAGVAASGDVTAGGRPMVFIGNDDYYAGGEVLNSVGVTTRTAQTYVYPYDPLSFFPEGPGNDALYISTAANHAGSLTSGTPVVGNEWLYVEHEIDLSNSRGNANGINRLHVWASDGKIAVIETELARGESFPFVSAPYWRGLQGIGGYWNNAVNRTSNDHCIVSHIRFSPNMAVNSTMGPPTGFLE